MRCGKNSMLTDNATGERFCGKCGYVISERVDESGPEWRSFAQDEHGDRARAGVPTSLAMHDMGLATIIGHENRDSTGKPLSTSMKSTVKRLRTWDSRSKSEPIDRNFRQAFSELYRLKDKLALSDAIIKKTAYLYRKAIDKGLVRGRSILGILVATLYIACRDSGTPRTLNDVSSEINIKEKDISRYYRLLLRELELKMPVVDPIKSISRIASKAGLSEKVERLAHTILKNASEMEITSGKDPMGLAAAALYLSCLMNGENTSQRVIALAAGVTEVTLRNRCKALKRVTII